MEVVWYNSRFAAIEKEFDNGRPGITVYHRSKKSAILIRIYDKAAERGLPEDRHWVRVELQLRDERASAFCFDPAPIGELFRGVLVNYVRYIDDPGTDSNRWRWPMKSYWENLIEETGRITLYVKPGVEYNIRQLDNFSQKLENFVLDTEERREQMVLDWERLQAQIADKHHEMVVIQERVKKIREVDRRLGPLVDSLLDLLG